LKPLEHPTKYLEASESPTRRRVNLIFQKLYNTGRKVSPIKQVKDPKEKLSQTWR